MTALRKSVPRYSIDDDCQWKGDWELWDGEPLSMSPSPFGRRVVIRTHANSEPWVEVPLNDRGEYLVIPHITESVHGSSGRSFDSW